ERQIETEHIRRAHRGAHAPPEKDGEQQQDAAGADHAHFFTEDRKNEIRVCFRQIEELLLSLHETKTRDSARCGREQGLNDLKPPSQWFVPWIHKRED